MTPELQGRLARLGLLPPRPTSASTIQESVYFALRRYKFVDINTFILYT